MKTAMQQLYADLEKLNDITHTISITDVQRMIGNYYIDIEKQQIEDSFFEGQDGRYTEFDNYYKETYNK